ncbi:MAG: class I SAM-dependent methyltransferase [Deltaproteobacteria bacterium]|nr:class I SAM-dependent methyltransferase [Deltaproteobacteria bacterium]
MSRLERQLYTHAWRYWINQLLLPFKLVLPQPLIARIPGLTTNLDIRVGVVLAEVRGTLVDIGCGTNRLVQRYRAQGGEGQGLDVHPWPGVDRVVADTRALPYPSGSVDTVTFVASLNHIPDREAVLREAVRILRPGGRVVITYLTPLVSRLWHAWAFWDADQHERGMEPGERFGFTDAEIGAMLERAGLRVLRRAGFSWHLNHLYVCEKPAA